MKTKLKKGDLLIIKIPEDCYGNRFAIYLNECASYSDMIDVYMPNIKIEIGGWLLSRFKKAK